MAIKYVSSATGISSDQLHGFFVGWPNPPSPSTHIRILKGSDEVVLAIDDQTDSVVGFITAITDKVITPFVPHLEVLPKYQGNGIGTELARNMVDRLTNFYAIDLTCDADVQPFYAKLGIKPHNAMLIRNREKQNGEENAAN
jgi:ribosomal protein S18 acetylase RimI-like enzyme